MSRIGVIRFTVARSSKVGKRFLGCSAIRLQPHLDHALHMPFVSARVVLPSCRSRAGNKQKVLATGSMFRYIPCFNGLMVGEKWRLREQTWKSSLRRK
jgi:hypothetical protein